MFLLSVCSIDYRMLLTFIVIFSAGTLSARISVIEEPPTRNYCTRRICGRTQGKHSEWRLLLSQCALIECHWIYAMNLFGDFSVISQWIKSGYVG